MFGVPAGLHESFQAALEHNARINCEMCHKKCFAELLMLLLLLLLLLQHHEWVPYYGHH